jgi:hypothetical protein
MIQSGGNKGWHGIETVSIRFNPTEFRTNTCPEVIIPLTNVRCSIRLWCLRGRSSRVSSECCKCQLIVYGSLVRMEEAPRRRQRRSIIGAAPPQVHLAYAPNAVQIYTAAPLLLIRAEREMTPGNHVSRGSPAFRSLNGR